MRVKLLLIGFITLGLLFALFQFFIHDSSAAISEKEARKLAAELYGGKVLASEKENGNFQMTLENSKGVYRLVMDGKTEKILDIKTIEIKEGLLTVEEAKAKIEAELKGKVKHIEKVAKQGEELARAIVEKGNKRYSVEFDLAEIRVLASTELPGDPGIGGGGKDAGGEEKISGENSAGISEQKAKEIALQQAGGTVTHIERTTTQKGDHYKVTIDSQTEVVHVYVQAATGNVSSVSTTTKAQPDDDGDDDDDDDD
ncbi:MAG TPA: PepSY domain-containing protein [Bacillaceae bacterium]